MFADALEMKLILTVGEKVFKIPGGNIKTLKLDIQPYGFKGQLSFWVSDEREPDRLFRRFIRHDLIKVRLVLSPHFEEDKTTAIPLILKGLVLQKDILTERTIENVRVKGHPVLYRHYRIAVADPAEVLWRQHFPCELMTDKCVKDLLEAHTGTEVALNYDWDILNREFAINTLPLGMEENDASFYDFVLWFVSSHNGVWSYNFVKDQYDLSADKPDTGIAVPMDRRDVEDLRLEFPQTIRNNIAVLNSYSEKPRRKDIEQKYAVDGIRHDHMGRFSIDADFEKCRKLEEQKIKVRRHELLLTFRRYPQLTYYPGCLFRVEGAGWSERIFPHGKVYRVRDILFDAAAVNTEITADHNMPYARYNVELTSRLELKSEDWVCLPPFKPPVFPLRVEGKIVSEQGESDAETYQIYQDADTSLERYRVAIPLWEDRMIVVPFEPDFFSGHFYIPYYKNARVLVALDFHSAKIERFLDWRAGARLPMDNQGNHILFGKTAKSKTSLQHTYVDNKPVLNVKRTSDKDTEMIKMVDGNLILETKEEE